MPFIDLAGRKLFFQEAGTGRPVLLLHGFPFSGESFRPQLEAPPEGHRLIVPDHRGLGRSEAAPGPLRMEDIASDAFLLLEKLGVTEPVVVGGVSMGGYAAMASIRHDPSRIRALALIDTHPLPDDAAGREAREQTAQTVEREGVEVLVKSMLPKLVAPRASAALKEEISAIIRANSPTGAAAALRGLALRGDSRSILQRFAGPAWVAGGTEDVISPPQKLREMAGLLSNASVDLFDGAGHLANQEVPEAFNPAFAAFLRGLG